MPQAISPPGEPIPSETLNELASFLMQAAATPWDVARGDEHEVARRIAKAAVEAMQSRQWWRLAFIEALRAQEPQTTPKVTEYNPMQAAAQAAAKATYEAIMNAPMSNCLGSPPKP
jgi:leucyl aminopeptidase (aminopeptidase T)